MNNVAKKLSIIIVVFLTFFAINLFSNCNYAKTYTTKGCYVYKVTGQGTNKENYKLKYYYEDGKAVTYKTKETGTSTQKIFSFSLSKANQKKAPNAKKSVATTTQARKLHNETQAKAKKADKNNENTTTEIKERI